MLLPNGTGYRLSAFANESFTEVVVSFTVSGPTSVTVPFHPLFSVTFVASGLSAGEWAVTFNGTTEYSLLPRSIEFVGNPNGTYTYRVVAVPGYTTNWSGSVAVRGADRVVSVVFTPTLFQVSFGEAGLPLGTAWSVTLGGRLESSRTSTILFSEPNGSLPFVVGGGAGRVPAPQSGELRVSGAPAIQEVAFLVPYDVTFSDAGLPAGTLWNVSIVGSATGASVTAGAAAGDAFSASFNSTAPTLVAPLPNGSYSYSVAPTSGFAALSGGGSLRVSGASRAGPAIAFAPGYTIAFTATGLPPSTFWSITVNGQSLSSSSASIAAVLPNGTSPFAVGGATGYAPVASSSAVGVLGFSETLPV
ncbi:MAG: hypothetical protein ACREEC_03780, partial [Thermoplasmata archaeon]